MSEFDDSEPIFRFTDNKGHEIEVFKENLLGKGGNGRVYKGLDLNDVRDVAVKVIAYRGSRELNIIIKEIKLLEYVGCTNKHIICYNSHYKDKKYIFIVTELILSSVELTEYIILHNNPEDVKSILLQLTRACKYILERYMLHLDLKPSNILVTPKDKQIKIIDFGVSCLYKSVEDQTSDIDCKKDTFGGTPNYISPDMIMHNINLKTDIYSLGWIFFYILSDKRQRSNVIAEVLDDNRITFEKIANLITKETEHDKLIPVVKDFILPIYEDYKDIVVSMIAYKPEDRPSYDDIISALNNI